MRLSEFVGQTLTAWIPLIHTTHFQEVKLHGIDGGGVWIESQTITNQLLSIANVQDAPRTLVFFVPFHEIRFLMRSIDSPSLCEKAFGLKS
jgi:hypothetical protein